jgi:hypothetical protein
MVDLEGPLPYLAAASHYKISRHRCSHGGCLFAPDCALFASFCFTIAIVCAPNPFFLSHFTLSLVACWLSLIRRLHILGGSIPWLQSLAVLLLGPIPWAR